jgi:hypothetical protein
VSEIAPGRVVVTTNVRPDDLADVLHDAWISVDTSREFVNSVVVEGWLDEGRSAFRFELCVTAAQMIRTTDPDAIGGFQLSDCRLAGARLLIWGEGPPGSVEIGVTPESTYQISRDSIRFMVKRFGRWKPTR